VIAFVDYNWGMLQGKNMPAVAAWILFTLIQVVNTLMNLSFTVEWVTVLLLATDFLICAGTSVLILVRTQGKVSVDTRDKQIAILSVLAIVLWVVFQSSLVGVWLNQVAYCLAFIPTYRNAKRNPLNEPTRPWSFWTLAFVVDLVALSIRPTSVLLDFVAPSVCLVWHLAITVLSLRGGQNAGSGNGFTPR